MRHSYIIAVMLCSATVLSATVPMNGELSPAAVAPTAHISSSSAPAALADSLAAPAAYLQLDSTYLDLGVIERDSIGEGVMKFRNTGTAPLVIHRVFTECGCTVPSYSSRPVEPGDSGEIRVRFKTKGRSLGYFRKSLRVKSNAENQRAVFSVKGRVVEK